MVFVDGEKGIVDLKGDHIAILAELHFAIKELVINSVKNGEVDYCVMENLLNVALEGALTDAKISMSEREERKFYALDSYLDGLRNRHCGKGEEPCRS